MITPQFKVTQDEEFIHIHIRVPYIRTSDLQFVVSENQFTFALQPYYLRLRLPGNLCDDEERTRSRYASETSMVEISIPKEIKGEHFSDLDMISKLLATKSEYENSSKRKPLIEEIGEVEPEINQQDEVEIDWEITQDTPPHFDSEDTRLGLAKYGFDDKYSGVIGDTAQEDVGNDINEIWDPSAITKEERAGIRDQNEQLHFNVDYYVADLHDNPDIAQLVEWESILDSALTGEEQDRVMRLGNRTFMLSNPKSIYIGLVAIMFGFEYDFRTTMGDPTVESAWTVGKLCPYFACLDDSFKDIKTLMRSCTRRALTFPLYRHWNLSMKVWDDVYRTLRGGRTALLKRFAILLKLFEQDRYSVYRQIWLEDYTVWVQYANENVIRSLAHELHKVQLAKSDVGLELEESEEIAQEFIAAGGE